MEVKSSQVKSSQVKSSQSSQVKSSQVKSSSGATRTRVRQVKYGIGGAKRTHAASVRTLIFPSPQQPYVLIFRPVVHVGPKNIAVDI